MLLIPVPILQVDGVNMTFFKTCAYLKKKPALYYERDSFAKYTCILMSFNTNNYIKYFSDSLSASNNQYKTPEGF